jgi:hypothetical protein
MDAAGLEAFGADKSELDFAVHHVGVATEHLMKAYLAGLHPAIIVDVNSRDSLLHATGQGAHARIPVSHIKTIGLVEAYDRCNLFLKFSGVDRKRIVGLSIGRGGVAHLGSLVVSDGEAAIATALQVTDSLLGAMGVDSSSFWGSFSTVHDYLVNAQVDRLRAHYEAKLANARTVFDERFGGHQGTDFDAVKKAISSVDAFPMRDSERADCPACGQVGSLVGDKRIEADYEYDRDGGYTGGAFVVMTPQMFECPFCRLSLEHAELGLAGLDVDVATEDDPADYVEYDDDDWRR